MVIHAWLGNIRIADGVFGLLIQSTILFLTGWLLMKLARRASAPVKSGILLTLLFFLCLLPAGILVLKSNQTALYKLPIFPVRLNAASALMVGRGSITDQDKVGGAVDGQGRNASSAIQAVMNQPGTSSDLREINPILLILNGFGLIWVVGFLLLLGRLFYGMAVLSGFRSSLVKLPEIGLRDILDPVRTAFPRTKLPSLYMSPAVDSPVALGIFHPMIVLPQSLYNGLSAEELRNILIHETAHIHHRDQVSGLLQRLLTSFYWWNPLAYHLSASFSVAREDVSDNYAIRKNGAHSYAHCLVALARKTSLITKLPAAVGMATPHLSLEDRIKNIVSKERVMKTNLSKPVVFLMALTALLFVIFIGRFSWTLTAAENAVMKFPFPPGMTPDSLAVDKDRIYITGSENDPKNPESHIAIFSASDFSLLKKIGQEGKGVGEFLMGPGQSYLINGEIWAPDIKKIVVFSRDGVFKKEIPIPREILILTPLLPVGNNIVTFTFDRSDLTKGIRRAFGRLYDSELRLFRQFYDGIPFRVPPPPPPKPRPPAPGAKAQPNPQKSPELKEDYLAIPECIDFAVAEDKIFVADTRKGFHISVFDSQGNPLYEINKDYTPLPVPPDVKEALQTKLQELNKRVNVKVLDIYPAFMSFNIADNKIYISTYAQKDGMHELIVMNLKGDILRRTFSFPLGPSYERLYNNFVIAKERYAIFGDKIYYLAKSENGNSYELWIQELNGTHFVRQAVAKKIQVSVSGKVLKPGVAEFNVEEKTTLLMAIAGAGGMAEGADPSYVVITRKDASGKEMKIRVNLKPILTGEEKDILLQGGDAVFVPEALINR